MRTRNAELRQECFALRERLCRQTVIYYIKCAVRMQVCDQVALRIFHTVGVHPAAERIPLVPQQRLVAAQDGRAARTQALEDFELGLADALARTEELDVGRADVGDDRVVRLRRRRHTGQLAEMVHAHLSDHDFGVVRHAHERQRQTDLVVQVALGLLRAELLRQHSVEQLLGGGLADRAGNADDRTAAQRAVAARQIEQRLRGVLDVQRGNGVFLAFAVAHHRRRAVFDGLADELMCVKALTLDRQEQRVRRDLPRVGRDRRQSSLALRFALCPFRRLR